MKRDSIQDLALSVLCLAGLCACGVLLLRGSVRTGPLPGVLPERPIGHVVVVTEDIRRRPHRTLVWETLRDGDSAYADDTLFVPPGSDASLVFTDGSTLELDENSLIVVEKADTETRVRLEQGALYAKETRSDISVETEGGIAQVAPNAGARVAVNGKQTRLDVYEGSAKVGDENVHAGSAKALGQPGTLPAPVAVLTSPDRNYRLYAQNPPPAIELEWQENALATIRVQVATNAAFDAPIADDIASAHFTLHAPHTGIYYWRLVDANGTPISETRRITFVEDTPPAPLRPATHEIVSALPSAMLAFVWMPAPGAKRYRVELAQDREFQNIIADAHSDSTVLYLAKTLAEGTYYWRVRVDPDERPGAPYSSPVAFRLITRSVLEAPKLLNSEVQVRHE